MPNTKLLYSTEIGKIKPEKKEIKIENTGNVKIELTKKGRGGKTVTIISNLPVNTEQLKIFSKSLKKISGTGGAVKNETIELQGDQTKISFNFFSQAGFSVKRSRKK